MTPDLFMLGLAVLFLLDVWTTLRILGEGGKELNPIMAKLMQLLSPAGALMGVKFGLLVWISMHAALFNLQTQRLTLAIYVGVVGWNLYQLWRARRG